MDLQLTGKTVFVTGGSRGIGRAIALGLLAEGANAAVCGRDETALAALVADAGEAAAPRLFTARCDVRDKAALQAAVEQAAAHFGGLDGVVANAGAGTGGTVLETPMEDWMAQYEIKLAGVLHLVKAALPHLRQSGSGRVLIMNGVTAHTPDGGMAAVSAARAAVAQVAGMLAQSLAGERVCVNTINLGAVETDRQKARYAQSGSPLPYPQWLLRESLRRDIPLGRLGQPGEVVPMALLLLSPLSSYITGTSIDVSGGL